MANGAATTSGSTGGTVSNPSMSSGGTDWTGLESAAWNDAAQMVSGAYGGKTSAKEVKKETKALAKVGSGAFAGIKSFLDHPLYLVGAIVLILVGILLIIGVENSVNIATTAVKAGAAA